MEKAAEKDPTLVFNFSKNEVNHMQWYQLPEQTAKFAPVWTTILKICAIFVQQTFWLSARKNLRGPKTIYHCF